MGRREQAALAGALGRWSQALPFRAPGLIARGGRGGVGRCTPSASPSPYFGVSSREFCADEVLVSSACACFCLAAFLCSSIFSIFKLILLGMNHAAMWPWRCLGTGSSIFLQAGGRCPLTRRPRWQGNRTGGSEQDLELGLPLSWATTPLPRPLKGQGGQHA